jgi:hypothetical protein
MESLLKFKICKKSVDARRAVVRFRIFHSIYHNSTASSRGFCG